MHFNTLDIIKFRSSKDPSELRDGKIVRIETINDKTFYWIETAASIISDIDKYPEEAVHDWNPRLKYSFTWPM